MLDVAVIGAGPCGLAAAVSAMKAGLSVVVLDKGAVVSTIAAYPLYATFFSTAEKLGIGGLPFITNGEKPTRRDALSYYRAAVRHFGVPVRQYEEVLSVEGARGDFTLRTRTRAGRDGEVRARTVIVATGYFGTPNRLGVPGEELPHVTHVYREGHEAFQRNALVVGGGNSAAEALLDLWRNGAEATLVYHRASWGKRIKPWILSDVENRIRDGAITARWHSRVLAIEPEHVVVRGPAGDERLRADHVYLLTGFAPDLSLLRRSGVAIDPDTGIPAHDPETLETSVPGMYVVGVLVAGFDANKVFIENGRFHGDRIVAHLVGEGEFVEPRLSIDADA